MTFDDHVRTVRDQLTVLGASTGGPVEEAAIRLSLAVEPAVRLALQGVLEDAARTLDDQLGAVADVEVRLQEGEPVLVARLRTEAFGPTAALEPTDALDPTAVLDTSPYGTPSAWPAGSAGGPVDSPVDGSGDAAGGDGGGGDGGGGDGGATRFTLRIPDALKARVDAAAAAAGQSTNTWFVQAAELRLRAGWQAGPAGQQGPPSRRGHRLTGWVG
ncbi:toxin-antitoxin system HicB family antitoxin [Miniimonas sp. S16]|uniref:toxin-antitoxin system HicB family antitoxin n=1 Tax=Miniimonas sp. S16 TaxID=2171623 RepID=UPI001901B6EA|nr:toxin-antitoxin system HicB family antitoxin [Miniimonas sp. S16]